MEKKGVTKRVSKYYLVADTKIRKSNQKAAQKVSFYLSILFVFICQTPAFYASNSSLLKDAFGARRSFIYFFNLLPAARIARCKESASRIREAGAQIALFRAIAAPRSETKNTKHLSLAGEPREREKSAIDWQRAGSFGRARTQMGSQWKTLKILCV